MTLLRMRSTPLRDGFAGRTVGLSSGSNPTQLLVRRSAVHPFKSNPHAEPCREHASEDVVLVLDLEERIQVAYGKT
jgi:hypothetical protein